MQEIGNTQFFKVETEQETGVKVEIGRASCRERV